MVRHRFEYLIDEIVAGCRCAGLGLQPLPGAVEHHGKTVGVIENAIRTGIWRDERHVLIRNNTCQDPDLNWGHGDFESTAIPSELSRPVVFTTTES